MKKWLLWLPFLWIVHTNAIGQVKIKTKGDPLVFNYAPDGYQTDGQVWTMQQDARGVMYIGNNTGIIEYDGFHWSLLKLPNYSIVRTMTIDEKGRIYVGGQGEFGYIGADSLGRTCYVSLLDKVPLKHRSFNDVWKVFNTHLGVVFQTTHKIYVLNKQKKIEVYFPTKKNFHRSFYVNRQMLVSEPGVGMLVLKNKRMQLIEGGERFANNRVYVVLPYDDDHLLFVTRTQGVFIYNGKTFEPWLTDSEELNKKKNNTTYCGLRIGTNYFAIGTLLSGVIILDKQGKVLQHINKGKGLQANIVLSLYLDREHSLWTGLENGISRIEIASPISYFYQNHGISGVIYNSAFYDKHLYLGSSQGVYCAPWKPTLSFSLLPSTQDQVWSFTKVPQGVVASSNGYIWLIDKNKVKRKLAVPKANYWQVIALADSTHLLAGTSNTGLALLDAKTLEFKHFLTGFQQDCRWVIQGKKREIWVSNSYSDGVHRLTLNDDLTRVTKVRTYGVADGLPFANSNRVFKINGKMLVATKKGVYKYKNDKFEPYETWNDYIEGSSKQVYFIKEDAKGNVYMLVSNNMLKNAPLECLVMKKQRKGFKVIRHPFAPLSPLIIDALGPVIEPVREHEIFFLIKDGLAHYDATLPKNYYQKFNTLLCNVKLTVPEDSLLYGGGDMRLPAKVRSIGHTFNALRFKYAATFFQESDKIKFQYFLEGFDQEWSQWSKNNYKEYNYLPEGEYTFRVRARNIYDVIGKEASYRFIILPPWYRTKLAYTLYVVLSIGLVVLIARTNTKRLRKRNDQLVRMVDRRTEEVREQKREIEAQRDNLIELNQEVNQKNEEITAQNESLELKTYELKDAFEEIKRQNNDITASIAYAYRIQKAMLPLSTNIRKAFPQHFIFWRPREIVSGDFYWFTSVTTNESIKHIMAVVDCTGHGVPGAFMSLIGNDLLNNIVKANQIVSADSILNQLHRGVKMALKQESTQNDDGMDIGLVVVDEARQIMEFAGANHPLLYIQNGEMTVVRGNTYPIGRSQIVSNPKYGKQIIDISQPTTFYMFSDGYQDQFGGSKGKKFLRQRFWDLLYQIHELPMHAQKETLGITFSQWQQDFPQIDDVLVLGVKLSL
ncbi:SpoIIE family protein phosphatase [Microscilla marina]|uniref:Two component regulator three Y motif family n=1 Tax=Microscilla marina ATCC 23134 TaxID=313606 RepID=A1ZDP3_MICM2|nr:SpoIIE family protein phosphatase [Microscilla marina]EAY31782.1 Two component regulator three Y motif family [Microscilla marina ATCC 23134]